MAYEQLAAELSQDAYIESALNCYTAYSTEAEAVALIKMVLEQAASRLVPDDGEKVRELKAQIVELNRQLDESIARHRKTAELLFRNDMTLEVQTLINFIGRVTDWDGGQEDARNARLAARRILEDPTWCPEGLRKG